MKFRKIASLGGAAALMAAGFIGASPSASAEDFPQYEFHPIELDSVCQWQGYNGWYSFDWGNAYSAHCYKLGFSADFGNRSIGVTGEAGASLNVQEFCTTHFANSVAIASNPHDVLSWGCRKELKPPITHS